MKLPLDLGVKLFFRLLLPGFFLTLGVLPPLLALLDVVGLAKQQEVAFVLAIIVVGWLIIAADMPIYMLLEGRRYWPPPLYRWCHGREVSRLGRLDAEIEKYHNSDKHEERQRYIEASVRKRSFPIQKQDGERYAASPTRLGNAIEAFETYSDIMYGLDAIFYWPRIWINLSKDLREELDTQQAMADSTVYTSFALAATGLLWCSYGLLEALNGPVAKLLLWTGLLHQLFGEGIFHYLPKLPSTLGVAVIFLSLSYFVYRLAIFSNEQFGNVFMAVIDSHFSKVKEYVAVDTISDSVSKLAEFQVAEENKFEIARAYLQYYRVGLRGHSRTVAIPRVKDRLREGGKFSSDSNTKDRTGGAAEAGLRSN